MREFKYRAWDKENKVMCDVEMLGEVILKIKGSEWENREDFVLMQSTGLRDSNGVEIYERDVVRIKGVRQPGVVTYNGKEFGLLDSKNKFYAGYKWEDWERYFEVIGNIYENPELLEVEK